MRDVERFWDEQAASFDTEPDHGLRDPSSTAWEGEVSVSEGRVLDLSVLDGDNAPVVTGSRFNVRTVGFINCRRFKSLVQ